MVNDYINDMMLLSEVLHIRKLEEAVNGVEVIEQEERETAELKRQIFFNLFSKAIKFSSVRGRNYYSTYKKIG